MVEKYGVEGIFNKRLLDGKIEERVEEVVNCVGLSLKLGVEKPKVRERLVKKEVEKREIHSSTPTKKTLLEALISGLRKTCLEDIWKVFYLDWKTKEKGYFLVNGYQRARELDDLIVGNTMNIHLVQGYKHPFLSKIL